MYRVRVDRFNSQEPEMQIDLLLKDGRCVAKYTDEYCHMLFDYEGFHVEVVYHKCGSSIVSIHAFCDDEILERYVNRVDISSVFA